MTSTMRFTSADLEAFPDDGKRYEIIDGELYVSKQPSWHHQYVCTRLASALLEWSQKTSNGMAVVAPGLIFAEDDDVAPDVVWLSNPRLATALKLDGKLHEAPELIIEVLSPGKSNERRDREAKLKLYSRRGVDEYWIVDWRARQIEVYRRTDVELALAEKLGEPRMLTSPLLENFSCSVSELFEGIPQNS